MWILEDCYSCSMAEFPAKAEKSNENEDPPSEAEAQAEIIHFLRTFPRLRPLLTFPRLRPLFLECTFGLYLTPPFWGWTSFHRISLRELERLRERLLERERERERERELELFFLRTFQRERELELSRAETRAEDINFLRTFPRLHELLTPPRLREVFRAETRAEDIKFNPYSFPKQKPGDFPVNKGGKDHLGELAEEPVNKGGKDHLGELAEEPVTKGGKDPDPDGQSYQDFTQCTIQGKVLDAEAHVMLMTARAA